MTFLSNNWQLACPKNILQFWSSPAFENGPRGCGRAGEGSFSGLRLGGLGDGTASCNGSHGWMPSINITPNGRYRRHKLLKCLICSDDFSRETVDKHNTFRAIDSLNGPGCFPQAQTIPPTFSETHYGVNPPKQSPQNRSNPSEFETLSSTNMTPPTLKTPLNHQSPEGQFHLSESMIWAPFKVICCDQVTMSLG